MYTDLPAGKLLAVMRRRVGVAVGAGALRRATWWTAEDMWHSTRRSPRGCRGVPVGPKRRGSLFAGQLSQVRAVALRTCRQSSSGPTSSRRGRLGAVEPRMEPLSRNEPATPHTGGWDGAVAHALVSDAAGNTEQLRHLVDAVGQGLCAVHGALLVHHPWFAPSVTSAAGWSTRASSAMRSAPVPDD